MRVAYSSAVRMPEVLRRYTSLDNFRTTIIKVTCVQAETVILNDVHLSDIPFIRRAHITSKMHFADALVETQVRAEFNLPWYLRFLQSTATASSSAPTPTRSAPPYTISAGSPLRRASTRRGRRSALRRVFRLAAKQRAQCRL